MVCVGMGCDYIVEGSNPAALDILDDTLAVTLIPCVNQNALSIGEDNKGAVPLPHVQIGDC